MKNINDKNVSRRDLDDINQAIEMIDDAIDRVNPNLFSAVQWLIHLALNPSVEESLFKEQLELLPKTTISVLKFAVRFKNKTAFNATGAKRNFFDMLLLTLAEKLDPKYSKDLGDTIYYFDKEGLLLVWDKISVKSVDGYELFKKSPEKIGEWFFTANEAEETLLDILESIELEFEDYEELYPYLNVVKEQPDSFFQKLCLLGKLPEAREFAKKILKERGGSK